MPRPVHSRTGNTRGKPPVPAHCLTVLSGSFQKTVRISQPPEGAELSGRSHGPPRRQSMRSAHGRRQPESYIRSRPGGTAHRPRAGLHSAA
jgi:hypothetical protein